VTGPRISVVMPALQAVATIERSLDSISSQQVPGTEIVVADGGSTDGTVDVLRARDDVRWVSEPDRGLSDAYNKGAALATGEVLGWLNADDAYLPGALALVRQAFAEDPNLVWLTGQCAIVDSEGREIRRGVTRYKNALLRHYSHRLHLTQNFVSAPATFFRAAAFAEVGRLDVSLRYSMDYDLYLRFGRTSAPRILDRPLAAFTMAEGTLSMTGFEHQFVEHQQVARRYRADAPSAYAVNVVTSRAIVRAYRAMRYTRQLRAAAAGSG
jgi:glycosyltransferase involved in cell wall biosynthesis